jgi:hypothetical protein
MLSVVAIRIASYGLAQWHRPQAINRLDLEDLFIFFLLLLRLQWLKYDAGQEQDEYRIQNQYTRRSPARGREASILSGFVGGCDGWTVVSQGPTDLRCGVAAEKRLRRGLRRESPPNLCLRNVWFPTTNKCRLSHLGDYHSRIWLRYLLGHVLALSSASTALDHVGT